MNLKGSYKFIAFILIFSAGIFLAGCKTEQDIPSSSASAESNSSGTLLVTSRDNGTSRQLNVGDTLEVSLLDNASDTNIWKVDDVDSSILHQVSEEYDNYYSYDPSPLSSCIGKVTLRFVAVKPGQTSLLLACRKPESGGTCTPDDTFELQVSVSE
jgi:hypothetical protein